MDRMTYYMGVTASSMYQMGQIMGRMSMGMEKMERKADNLVQRMNEKGKSAERSIQNYGQAFIDNDRALIKSLKGIRSELAEMKQPRPTTESMRENTELARKNKQIRDRIRELEVGAETLSARVKKMEERNPLNE